MKLKTTMILAGLLFMQQGFGKKPEMRFQCEDTGHSFTVTFEENELQLIPESKVKPYSNKVGGTPFYLLLDHPFFDIVDMTFNSGTGLTFYADSRRYPFNDYFRFKPTPNPKIFQVHQVKRLNPVPKAIKFNMRFIFSLNCEGVFDFSTVKEVKK